MSQDEEDERHLWDDEDEDDQSELDDNEADSFVDTRSEIEVLEEEMDLETDDSIPYYISHNSHYDRLDSSTDCDNYDSDESEEDEDEDKGEDKEDEGVDQDEDSDDTIREAIMRSVQRSIQNHSPQNRLRRRGRNVVDSDED
jgi:hypothetical protein